MKNILTIVAKLGYKVKFRDGKLGLEFEHMEPLIDSDGGHGMIFSNGENTYFRRGDECSR